MNDTIGARIKKYRTERGLSQGDLGFSAPYISRIENGNQSVTPQSLAVIAGKMGVTALELETGDPKANCYFCGRSG